MVSPKRESAGPRLSSGEALGLLRGAETADLMARADAARRRLHGNRTHYVHSLNLNPTNLCENRCKLCAFWRDEGDRGAYTLTLEDARARMEQAKGWELTDLHIVGGLSPKLGLAYYESLIRLAGEILPGVLVQGLTAVEIHYLAQREKLPVAEVLRRLKGAGLGALPGGGAEIFNPQVRQRICEKKITAEQWLAVHAEAHALGLPTNATILFGHLETDADILDHLDRLRQLQGRTGGFQALIALPFHVEGTELDVPGPAGHLIARVVAVARIFLDNFPHVRVLANYMDRKLLGVLTHGGADDVGGTSLDERIARAAGAAQTRRFVSRQDMEEFLRDLHLEPVLVNSVYEPAKSGWHGGRRLPPCADDRRGNLAANDGRHATCTLALDAASEGKRLSAEQAALLLDHAPVHQLGLLAHRRRMATVPYQRVTFTLDRNINVTNICEAACRFCAFHVKPGQAGGFTLTQEQVVAKGGEAASLGATQILIQGGLNPGLGLDYYEGLFRAIKGTMDICLHSLSPAEVQYLAKRGGLTIAQCLGRLKAAGLDSLPGGGAEILVDEVRRRVSPHKISAGDWLAVMEAAHGLGMKTTATMVYGLGETTAQRVEHLLRVRELQDRTGGFTAFIPWSFQPNRTQIPIRPRTGVDYLRMVALARLVLDNIPHVQAGWVTEGPDVAQLALSFGADDWGGVLMEENVVKSTGVSYSVGPDDVIRLIRATGMTPAQRTTQYQVLREFASENAPLPWGSKRTATSSQARALRASKP